MLSQIMTALSAYQILLIHATLTLIHFSVSSKPSRNMATEYKLNKSRNKTHPCRSSLFICMGLKTEYSNFGFDLVLVCTATLFYNIGPCRTSFL